MLKLYYATHTCATACRIALEEAELEYSSIEVSWKKNINVEELKTVNPLGAVPTLVSNEGKILTQNMTILEYIADLKPSSHLLAEAGSWERRETLSFLSFVAADFHKTFSLLFRLKTITSHETAQQDILKYIVKNVQDYLEYINNTLAGKDYIMGKQFSIADTYLYVVIGWCKFIEVNTDNYKNIVPYIKRITDRPAVQKVLKSEG